MLGGTGSGFSVFRSRLALVAVFGTSLVGGERKFLAPRSHEALDIAQREEAATRRAMAQQRNLVEAHHNFLEVSGLGQVG